MYAQAQEQLLEVPWPTQLLQHPYCAPVHLGAACVVSNPEAAAALLVNGRCLEVEGPVILAGLRVRMGINTGALCHSKPALLFPSEWKFAAGAC
jgi:hypothetical protein